MANELGNYDPTFYAAEGLMWLYQQLGFSGRVHMGYDAERDNARVGSTIAIRRPFTFESKDHAAGVGSDAQDVGSQDVEIKLARHKEVKFAVTSVELAYTGQRIIDNHIKPAAYAIAKEIDQYLHSTLTQKVGPVYIVADVDGAKPENHDYGRSRGTPQE